MSAQEMNIRNLTDRYRKANHDLVDEMLDIDYQLRDIVKITITKVQILMVATLQVNECLIFGKIRKRNQKVKRLIYFFFFKDGF